MFEQIFTVIMLLINVFGFSYCMWSFFNRDKANIVIMSTPLVISWVMTMTAWILF